MHNLYISVQAEKSELVLQRHALIDVGCGMDEHIYKLHARRPKQIGNKGNRIKSGSENYIKSTLNSGG